MPAVTGVGKSIMNAMSGSEQNPSSSQGRDDEIDLMVLLRALWRGWPFLVLCLALGGVWGWYKANISSVPIYSATATMLVDQSVNPRSGDATSAFFGYGGVNASAMNTEMEIVTSRDLTGQLVDRLDLAESPLYNPHLAPPPRPAGPVEQVLATTRGWMATARGAVSGVLVSLFSGDDDGLSDAPPEAIELTPEQERQDTISFVRGALSASFEDRSYLFYISAMSPDPDEALRLANAMAEVYRNDNQQQKIVAAEQSAVWLSERVTELRREIDDQQATINTRRAENALIASDSGLTGFESQLANAESRRFETERALASAEASLARLTAAESGSPEEQAEAAGDAQLRTLARNIAAGDTLAQARFDLRYAQLQQQAQSEVERHTASLATISADIVALTDQIARTGEAFGDIRQMEQELQSAQLLYDTFATQLREVTIRLGSQQSDVRILSEAIAAVQIAPRKVRIFGVSLAVALVLGAAIVLLREMLHHGFRSAGELEEQTGLAVLGQIPRIPARSRARQVAWLVARPASAAAEAVRNLRTSVLLSNVDQPPQMILTTSAVPGEGKTTVSIALAHNLAGLDRRVLLIEGDLRRRTFPTYFPNAGKQHGLLSAISGDEELDAVVYHDSALNIDVLMGEQAKVNAADVLSSERFRSLLQELRGKYDHIVIDTPPVLAVPDARVIAPLADAVLFVVKWNRTPRSLVEDALKLMHTVNIKVGGLVLAQVDPKGMRRYGYGNRYGGYTRKMRRYYEG